MRRTVLGIVVVVSAEVAPGKRKDAVEWTKEVGAYVESKGLHPHSRAMFPQFGTELNRMMWTWEWESMAEMEENQKAVDADGGVQERIKKGFTDIFVPGSARRQMYRDAQ